MAMKLPVISLLLVLSALSLLSFSADARPGRPFHPCNTLVISTISFSLHPNPNSNPNFHPFLRRPNLITVIDLTEIPSDHPHHHHHPLPHHLPPSVGFSSFKDRTKDILSIVVSLLFGAACGALTAATVYLIWSLFNPHHNRRDYRSMDGFSSDDDGNDDDDDIFNPKKKGYVAIPAAPAAVDSAVKAAPAKESA